MEWLTVLLGKKQSNALKTADEIKQEALVQQGREQFQTLLEKGLNVPVALL